MADEPRFRSLREKVAGRNEALGQGLTFGFGDELGAGIQGGMAALTPGMDSGKIYKNALSENRGILADEKAAEPGTAAALEAIGSIPTSFVIPGAAGGLGTALKVGGALGAVSGLGHADGGDVGSSVLKGTAGGLAGGAIGHGVGKLAAPIFQKLARAARLRPLEARPSFTRDYGEMSPDQIKSLGTAEALQQKFAQRRDLLGPIPSHDIVDPTSGRVLVPGDPKAEARAAADLTSMNKQIDAGAPIAPVPRPAENRRFESLQEALRTERQNPSEEMTQSIQNPFDSTKRTPGRK